MLTGSIVALVTPMDPEGAIDEPALKKLIDWHIEHSTQALLIAGTTGEATLSREEKLKLIQCSVTHAAKRVPIIAGTAMIGTEHTIAFTQEVMATGADFALIMTPAYIKPTQAGLIQHYQKIVEAVPIPIILYNVPGRTACDLLPKTVAVLADLDGIVAIKEATGSIERLRNLQAFCSDKLRYFSGDDTTATQFMLSGGHGVISVTANVVPQIMAKLCQFCLTNQASAATALNAQLDPLHRALFLESNPIPVKCLLAKMGFISNTLRLPLTALSEHLTHQLYNAYLMATTVGSDHV